jgi:glycosyltransferase involved in cell wall biosynthesis
MRIYAISLIKNEADIIRQNLEAAAKWATKIFVYDNGSSDGTWEIVKSMESPVIIPFKSENKPYRDSLRQEVFEHIKHELDTGDWICFKLDADEFYIDNPREFLAALPNYVSLVHGLNIEFQFTNENLSYEDENFNPKNFKFAKIETTEERFIKFRKGLQWKPNDSIPIHPGVSSRKLICFAHYQFRSPSQIIKRLSTRKTALESGYEMYWERDLEKDWKSMVQSKSGLIEIVDLKELSNILRRIKVNTPESLIKKLIKFIAHGLKIWP